jgi:hypothetical protein
MHKLIEEGVLEKNDLDIEQKQKFEGTLYCAVHFGKKYRKFPPQITEAAGHNTTKTENLRIKFSTSILECSAM